MPDIDLKRVYLHKHTRREFRERMQKGELKACIIPVAATEQHLEHLAMEHDWASVMHIATLAGQALQPNVIVAPAMNIGISEHHMRHIGTLSAQPGPWLGILHDTIRSMHHAGFRNILVLNGHGGNVAPCNGMWGQFLQRFECNLQFISYWDLLPKEIAEAHPLDQALARPRPGIRDGLRLGRLPGERPPRRHARPGRQRAPRGQRPGRPETDRRPRG